MGVGLADQDEGEPLGRSSAAKRLVAGAVVAEEDRLQPAACPAMRGQPALGGSELAALLLRAVLRADERRGQRDDVVTPGLTSTGVRAAW
jgi:hypothetical protein